MSQLSFRITRAKSCMCFFYRTIVRAGVYKKFASFSGCPRLFFSLCLYNNDLTSRNDSNAAVASTGITIVWYSLCHESEERDHKSQ